MLAAELGAGWLVREEGLPGRTTVYPDPVAGVHKNGFAVLPAILESHRPIDVVVLMLGTNDLKHRFQAPVVEIAESVGAARPRHPPQLLRPGRRASPRCCSSRRRRSSRRAASRRFSKGRGQVAAAGRGLCRHRPAPRCRLPRRGRGDRVEPARRRAFDAASTASSAARWPTALEKCVLREVRCEGDRPDPERRGAARAARHGPRRRPDPVRHQLPGAVGGAARRAGGSCASTRRRACGKGGALGLSARQLRRRTAGAHGNRRRPVRVPEVQREVQAEIDAAEGKSCR